MGGPQIVVRPSKEQILKGLSEPMKLIKEMVRSFGSIEKTIMPVIHIKDEILCPLKDEDYQEE